MGRLFLPRLSSICFLALVMSNILAAQESYFIIKTSGKPLFNNEVPVRRGENFGKQDTLNIKKSDTVFLINRLGELFEFNEPNGYPYDAIISHRKQIDNNSLSMAYFTYVWKQFTNQKEIRQRPGVVYREDRNIKLLNPLDSAKLYVPKIEFSWKNKIEHDIVFFHLQDMENGHIAKIGTITDELILFRDNVILKSGRHYKWAVTPEAFPDFSKVKFHDLLLLTKDEYLKLKIEMEAITKALSFLGFSEEEINKAICMDYKFCEG